MSKQTNSSKQQSVTEKIAECQRAIDRLDQECAALQGTIKQEETAAQNDPERARLSYAAVVQKDAAADKLLAEKDEAEASKLQALRAELRKKENARAVVQRLLAEAQAVEARDERRAAIKEQQKRSKEFREIGPFLDRATDHLRRGLLALAKNAGDVGKDFRHVHMLHRVLQVALFDTPFRDAFGVPDANDRRSFSSFSGVINQWCDSRDANLQYELQALDEQKKDAA